MSQLREVVLDTETTGLKIADGHRVIEIGCVELIDKVYTGNRFQVYIDPERDVPLEAVRIHGITTEMLKGKPKFSHVVDEFLGFVGNASLVIHNAKFDIGFLNHELGLLGRKEFKMHKVTDTLLIARNKFPGSPANLDALCDRFKIDKTSRKLHGALLDAELLALVYLNLVQAEQTMMQLDITHMEQLHNLSVLNNASFAKAILSEEEKVQHEEAIAKIESSLWKAVEDQRPKS